MLLVWCKNHTNTQLTQLYMKLTDYLYFDIETAGKYKDVTMLKQAEPILYELLLKKYNNQSINEKREGESIDDYYLRVSSIIPEYGKIVCVSVGRVDQDGKWWVSSITGDEIDIINRTKSIFIGALNNNLIPCGYNILTFDLPWLNKKFIKHGVRLPYNLLLFDKKPWDVNVLDLFEVWKSTGRYWSSMDEVAYELGIKSSKTKLSGDKVHYTFWYENDVNKIAEYCEDDVRVLKDIISKFISSYV